MVSRPYDVESPSSIENFGKKLVGTSLRRSVGTKPMPIEMLDAPVSGTTRHYLGELVEKYYYGINPDNEPCSPDFKDAGVELKTSALKRLKTKGVVPKERLVFGMIDYMSVHEEEFESSCFLAKSRLVMALWYLHEDGVPIGELRFEVAKLLDFDALPAPDRAVIREDWEAIAARIRSGEAELLGSEHTPTRYLEALTKGSSGQLKPQANSPTPAKPRAFAFKGTYLRSLLRGDLENEQRLFETPAALAADGFEQGVLKRFERYLGMSEQEIASALEVSGAPSAKGYRATLARAMMGVRTSRVAEFERADILMKTVHHVRAKLPKEHMSFPAFRFMGEGSVLEEIWEAEDDDDERLAEIKATLRDRRFLFVVFEEREGASRLSFAKFWTMPERDIEEFVRPVWERTRDAIRSGRLEDLPRTTFNRVSHVRPHATKGETFPTPRNGDQTKRCFWLDRAYLAEQMGIDVR